MTNIDSTNVTTTVELLTATQLSNYIFEDAKTHFSELSNSYANVNDLSVKRRTAIEPRCAKFNFKSLITILKNASLGEYSLPVSAGFNEPLSYMQKGCEGMQFSFLLDKASECQDSLVQMVYVAAFDIALISCLYERTAKPFTPLLNETYECDRTQDLGWRFMSEYYNHYPPTYAFVS